MNGIELIAKERERQITAEGWAGEHDEEQDMGQTAAASMFSAERNIDKDIRFAEKGLRFNSGRGAWLFCKPSPDPIRNLDLDRSSAT